MRSVGCGEGRGLPLKPKKESFDVERERDASMFNANLASVSQLPVSSGSSV